MRVSRGFSDVEGLAAKSSATPGSVRARPKYLEIEEDGVLVVFL